jgi:hypothetical protein
MESCADLKDEHQLGLGMDDIVQSDDIDVPQLCAYQLEI